MAKSPKQSDGALLRWVTILGVVAMIGGWIWNAASMSTALQENCNTDKQVHAELQQRGVQNREDILTLKSDVRYIREGIDDIKKELKQ